MWLYVIYDLLRSVAATNQDDSSIRAGDRGRHS
jgi:hypothetical protein